MAASRYTDLGTPAAPTWSVGWFERVDHAESQLGRRICGAMDRGGALPICFRNVIGFDWGVWPG